ncbi:hypothetical protein B0H12DRAFT_1234606 [Mycena haematopus]|nr:hypothetical protein B0H12DRAFT_1234606 [Mycena haematopus]
MHRAPPDFRAHRWPASPPQLMALDGAFQKGRFVYTCYNHTFFHQSSFVPHPCGSPSLLAVCWLATFTRLSLRAGPPSRRLSTAPISLNNVILPPHHHVHAGSISHKSCCWPSGILKFGLKGLCHSSWNLLIRCGFKPPTELAIDLTVPDCTILTTHCTFYPSHLPGVACLAASTLLAAYAPQPQVGHYFLTAYAHRPLSLHARHSLTHPVTHPVPLSLPPVPRSPFPPVPPFPSVPRSSIPVPVPHLHPRTNSQLLQAPASSPSVHTHCVSAALPPRSALLGFALVSRGPGSLLGILPAFIRCTPYLQLPGSTLLLIHEVSEFIDFINTSLYYLLDLML